MNTSTIRLYTWAGLAAALVLLAAPAHAQYTPRPLSDPATGERFHIEAGADFWMPSTDISISSEALGIEGSNIDLKRDLGATDQRFRALQLMLRPSKAHKFRFQYIPIKYTASSTLARDVVFNGIRYRAGGLPVNTDFDWKAYRFGYEFDFLTRNRWFAGFLLEAKYTDVKVQLDSPIASEFAHARGPIPAIGGIGRFYVVPNISITGEVTGFTIPDSIDQRYNAHYVDVDIFGTVNFNDYVGVKGGYRSSDVGYLINADSGAFKLKGLYFGAVIRY
jgi:hypothetical protein